MGCLNVGGYSLLSCHNTQPKLLGTAHITRQYLTGDLAYVIYYIFIHLIFTRLHRRGSRGGKPGQVTLRAHLPHAGACGAREHS